MPSFKDKNQREWKVSLDAPLIEEVEEKHGIQLTNLEKDPLIQIRNDPMKLVAVIWILCKEKADELGIDPKTFGRSLPSPPDEMLNAVRDAIVDFFPSGRASHVREVLTSHDEMAAKTDALMIKKMEKIINDPNTTIRIETKADLEFETLMNKTFPLNSSPGT